MMQCQQVSLYNSGFSMTLKTLHLTNAWHETSGGIATFYRALLRAANGRGHFMTLVVPGQSAQVEKVGDRLLNVEIDKVENVKDPVKERMKH